MSSSIKNKLEYIVFNDKVNTFNDYVLHGTDANLIVYLNINKNDLNAESSNYWNDGREVYYKGEWEYINNIPTPIN